MNFRLCPGTRQTALTYHVFKGERNRSALRKNMLKTHTPHTEGPCKGLKKTLAFWNLRNCDCTDQMTKRKVYQEYNETLVATPVWS